MSFSSQSSRSVLALSALFAVGPTNAQNSQAAPAETLDEMVVKAIKPGYKVEKLQSTKYTAPLLDVPQTITVVPKQIIKEQNAASLTDILRNSPGISMTAGEGGAAAGDNLSMRGFSARTDTFVDGVRDANSGGYVRDAFNIEQVEISKGPSSANNGTGSTGGSINLATKTPTLKNATGVSLTAGTSDYARATLDYNQAIKEIPGAAFRFNSVYHTQFVPGRDHVSLERWGFAPSLAFGLETNTRFILKYSYLDADNVPDYGQAWAVRGNAPSTNYYGFLNRDYEKLTSQVATAIFEHDFNEKFSFRNTLRYNHGNRLSSITAPRFNADGTQRADAKTRDQHDYTINNTSELTSKFSTGKVEHELLSGVMLSHDSSTNYPRTAQSVTLGSIQTPNAYSPVTGSNVRNGSLTEIRYNTLSLYAFDTVKLNEQWELNGGVRYDHLSSDGRSLGNTTAANNYDIRNNNDDVLSYRGAIVYKPQKNGSIYLGYGTSFNPSVEGGAYGTSRTNFSVKPEQSNTTELGTKWDLLDNKLSLTGSVFRTVKTNARTTDPTSLEVRVDGEQEVQGFELGFSGQITDDWRVFGGYTFLDSKLKKALEVNNIIGADLAQTPEHSFSLWTVYSLPKNIELGVGARFVGSRYNATTTTRQRAAQYTVLDAMIGYRLNDTVSFRINGYNLGNVDYIDSVGGGHYIPGAGRSLALTTNFDF